MKYLVARNRFLALAKKNLKKTRNLLDICGIMRYNFHVRRNSGNLGDFRVIHLGAKACVPTFSNPYLRKGAEGKVRLHFVSDNDPRSTDRGFFRS